MAGVTFVLWCLATQAHSACSRPILIAVAGLGLTITTTGSEVGGIVPDLLRKMGHAAGCEFKFIPTPRARAEAMFAAGQSDLLLTATHTPTRDKLGKFIPLLDTRAMLIHSPTGKINVHSLQELLSQRELQVVLVRGFDYGDAYQDLVKKLATEKRLILVPDPVNVARMLDARMADVTIMLPMVMAGAIADDPRLKGMMDNLQIEPLEELPWGEGGSYVSTLSLSAGDQAELAKLLGDMSHSKLLWDAYRSHYPANFLEGSLRLH